MFPYFDPSSTKEYATSGYMEILEKGHGCVHYDRRAQIVAPCCNKLFSCRFCHDDNETHEVNRKAILEICCNACNKRQLVSNKCEDCGIMFGSYYCRICRLFANGEPSMFHCDSCGICRVGERKNYFHCDVCNNCLPVKVRKTHKCCDGLLTNSGCSGCILQLDCGHSMHVRCMKDMKIKGKLNCQTCRAELESKTGPANLNIQDLDIKAKAED